MLKLIKEFKPFTVLIFITIGLLFIQAMADLALPDYMSNIVNIGVQQNGIENAVPEVMRVEEMEKIKIFLNQDEISLLNSNYTLIDRENLTEKEYKKYIGKYPTLENENLYILNKNSQEYIDEMNSFLGKAIIIVSSIENGAPIGIGKSDEANGEDFFGNIPEGMDPFVALKNLPQEQLDSIRTQIDYRLGNLPDTMITQTAITHIKDQYESMGIN
ncbi:MAG: ABC transporter ATP-binding protein, partial [Tissierellia bacterium]|nr:ABC transporter ATP-binding protein [Tissierellia bacterium]